jgi:tetratricopeptide (TPR) repeat protein
LVFTASAIAFLPALKNGFVWDDYALIVRTLGFRGFDLRHLRWMASTTHMANYTPLAWLSYAFDFKVWHLNPLGYHLTNVLLHALNAVLFYSLSRLLMALVFSSDESSPFMQFGALFSALAFSLSPLRVESVAWAAERRDVLAGFFFLSAVLLYCRAAASREPREQASLRLLSLAAYFCAALSKATVTPLPAVLIALDYYPLRRLGAGEKPAQTRAVLLEKLPYAAIGLFCAAMAVRAQVVSGNLVAVAEHAVSDRVAQVVYGLGFYARMSAWPSGLSALYPLAEGRGPLVLHALVSAAVLLAAVLILWAAGVPRKAQIALWGSYVALLLPVLGLVQNGPQSVALRYSYLSCLGWAVLAGCAAAVAARERQNAPRWSSAALALLLMWLGGNVWAVQNQLAVWRDGRTLWESVARRFPSSPDANMNLADAYLQANEPAAALASADAALRLGPTNRTARLTRARALAALGRADEARVELERELLEDSDWGEGRALLGVILSGLGRSAQAADQLARAAALLPGSAEAQANAGAGLAMQGRFTDALPYFEQAARIDPANPSYAAQLERVRDDAARHPATGTKGATTK